MRSLYIIFFVLFSFLSASVSAQSLPAPSAAKQSVTPPVILPNTAPAPSASPVLSNAIDEETEKLTQQIRAEERKQDLVNTGLQWTPWLQIGKSTRAFIVEREKNLKSLIESGRYVDVAVYDFDHNDKPDIILYFWGDCGNQGCLYKIYYDNLRKSPEGFFGYELTPYRKGIMLNHVYFSL